MVILNPMQDNYLLIISLIINCILACILFFKSALNEILKQWWLQRQSAKKDKRERLSDIRLSLLKLQATFPFLLLDIVMVKTDPKLAQKTRGSHFTETTNAFKEENAKLRENEIYCTIETQDLLKNLKNKFEDSSSKLLSSNFTKESILAMIDELSKDIERIVNKVEEEIKTI